MAPTTRDGHLAPPGRPSYKRSSSHERRQTSLAAFKSEDSLFKLMEKNKPPGKSIERIYAGISVRKTSEGLFRWAVAFHDGTYIIGCWANSLHHRQGNSSGESSAAGSGVSTPKSTEDTSKELEREIIEYLRQYRKEKLFKPMGAAMSAQLAEYVPRLALHLWTELDILPFVYPVDPDNKEDRPRSLHEEAEHMAGEAVKEFSVNGELPVRMGHHRQVLVDDDGRVRISELESYDETVNNETTGVATRYYADSLKKNKTKIAFFNSTPQGGGVALMRHALIRYLRLLGVDCKWYVPVGKSAIFRITKDNHNILQGVAVNGERLTDKKIESLDNWVQEEAEKCHWMEFGGPLSAREKGGADVIIVDDPQMPSLVRIAKEKDPNRPVIFRSHIQVRADLADQPDTPTAEVWNWIWNHVKACDVFVSHPVRAFVPAVVTTEKVGYLPATTDWLDGLNKHMNPWDEQYYLHEFNVQCFSAGMRTLSIPGRRYIVQIARFDPAKGIPDVLASYALLRKQYMADTPLQDIPQLVIAGHGAVDDPDATKIFAETEDALATQYADIRSDVIVMRIGPSDQMLNALMSCAHVALQLSTREGFEVKVSEALHKGTPIIATLAGGIPLQVQHGKSGFLVKPHDHDAVARHLYHLFTDSELHTTMSDFAERNVSDEVSTVGNALSWLYLADTLAKGEEVKPSERWINDLAREGANVPYKEMEVMLERDVSFQYD